MDQKRLSRLLRDAREGVTWVKRIVSDLKDFAGIHLSNLNIPYLDGKALLPQISSEFPDILVFTRDHSH
jgi:hypothetical protein